MKKLLFLSFYICICNLTYSQNVFGFEYYYKIRDSLLVTKVYKNGPAEKAGLQKGDLIEFLNDDGLTYYKEEDLKKKLIDAPLKNNVFLVYRNKEVVKITIDKAPLSSFEFTCISGNCQNGDCIIEAALGYRIKGKCEDGKISGEATIFDESEKLIYKGRVINNIKQGFGVDYNSKNNTRYEGLFSNGIREGAGKYYLSDNSYLQGNWINNKLDGEVAIYDANHQLKEKQYYKDGKKVTDTKPLINNAEIVQNKTENKLTSQTNPATQSTSNYTYTKAGKNPSIVNGILDAKTGTWDFDFFSDKFPAAIPKKQKPPFEKGDYKTLASTANLTPDALKKVAEQCAYENWPSFYKNYPDINTIFKYAFRNLIVQNILTFRVDKDNGEYRSYGQYTLVFIQDSENKHAPKEMLSDDGVGFFMCVDAELIQKFMNPSYNYTSFTLDKPSKGGGFGNWTNKKEVYLLDMISIEDQYYNSGWNYSDKEVQTSLGLSDAEFKKLKDLCAIQNRPDGLKTAQQIKDAQHNAVFADMKVYSLANLGSSYLIYVPKDENYHLAQNMQPKGSEGWFFCTKSYVNTSKPDDAYVMKIKATTDASMKQYRLEQTAREEKMKQDAEAKAAWSSKNKFKGVVIIQYENAMVENMYDRYKYNIITIFAPPARTVEQSDYSALLDKYRDYYKASGYKYVAINFEEGIDEVKATEKANELTQTHKFAVNTNLSYTLPEYNNQSNNSNSDWLKKSEQELKELQKTRDKISKEIIEDKTMEKSAMRQKAMTDIFAGKNSVNNPAQVTVLDISTSDKNYLENKKYIGKTGTVETSLIENGDGTYYGTIQFPNIKYSTVFYNVKVKIIE